MTVLCAVCHWDQPIYLLPIHFHLQPLWLLYCCDKMLEKTNLKKDLSWFTAPEVSVHGHSASTLWACGMAEHHGK
jgi:hypothetical protein